MINRGYSLLSVIRKIFGKTLVDQVDESIEIEIRREEVKFNII